MRFLPLLLTLLSTLAGAQSVTKTGIVYTATGENTASVTGVESRLIGTKTIEEQVVIAGRKRKVSAISYRALADQIFLRSLTLPATLDSLGNEAFQGCYVLQELNGLQNVRHIGDYALSGTALEKIDMSGWDAEYMGHGLFARCTSLTQVRLPGNISSLPARTFSGCTSLRQTNIGELAGLRTIGEGALAGCSSLAQISLPPSLRVIESLAFDGMSSLSSLELPQALTTIGDYAFRGCSSLGALVLPDAVTTLGLSPFYGCSALQQVVLSANLRNISDNYIFDHCPALQSIEISASNTLYSSSDGVLYNRAKNQIIAWPAALSRTKHPVLPTSATPLARGALMDCLLDENFCLPERMNTLPYDALTRTTGLRYLTTGAESRLSTIEARAICNCQSLQVIELPTSLRRIGEAAFQGCTDVEEVVAKGSSPPTVHITCFNPDVYLQARLHVGEGRKTTYGSHAVWGCFANIIDDAFTTGLPSLAPTTVPSPIYDLSGKRTGHTSPSGQFPRKGIYIIGGKKVLDK